jgi:hypothetical protein
MLRTGSSGGGLGKGKTWTGGDDERDGGVDEHGVVTGGGMAAKSLPAGQNRQHLSRQQQQHVPAPASDSAPTPQPQMQQVPDMRTSRNNIIVRIRLHI